MNVAIANLKGGTGKTTTAVYLATGLAGYGRTLLVDSDHQRSAMDWSEQAAETADGLPVTVAPWPTRDLAKRVQQVGDAYEHIVIDTPPGHETIVRQALMVADVLVITLAPALMELSRLRATFDLAAEIEALHPVTSRVLLTRVDRRTNSYREARAFLNELGVPSFSTEIRQLEMYKNAYGLTPSPLGEYADVLAELLAVSETAEAVRYG